MVLRVQECKKTFFISSKMHARYPHITYHKPTYLKKENQYKNKKIDYEYERNGTCNLFAFFAPYLGWRHIKVTQRRTKVDFAYCMKDLVDVHFKEAEVIRLVMDNLNTHTTAALYEVFKPA